MKVRVNINQQGIVVNEVFTGNSADEIVGGMKARVAREVNFVVRMVINGMSNLAFAQEVVKKYNETNNKQVPLPNSCEGFLQSAQSEGFATLES